MVLSEEQVRTVLVQLGLTEDQITKELIEEIQLNCKTSLDIINYAQEKGLIGRTRGSSGRGRNYDNKSSDTIEGILIAASEDKRFDALYDTATKQMLSFRDYMRVRYFKDDDCYALVDDQGNIVVDESGNARIQAPIEQYVGYLYDKDRIVMLKSNKPLPTKPCYVKLNGRQYKNVFVVNNIEDQRELSELEWEALNDFIDKEIMNVHEKLYKECTNEPIIFIGRVQWSGVERQGERGQLDLKTVFRVGNETIQSYGVTFPARDAGIFVGLLNVKKRIGKDGQVYWNRTLLHPVKIQK